ncbi:MAG: hypothetical protein HXY25_03090 [Alphaproteobacteria bacterium]|nr:hypothetical protein [Alphaproteobacteria bacterium]
MRTTVENAAKRLFDGEHPVKDVKLFPGHSRDITKEQLADQIIRVMAEIDSGSLELREFTDND